MHFISSPEFIRRPAKCQRCNLRPDICNASEGYSPSPNQSYFGGFVVITHLISWGIVGPYGSFEKSTKKFSLSDKPPVSVFTSTCTMYPPWATASG